MIRTVVAFLALAAFASFAAGEETFTDVQSWPVVTTEPPFRVAPDSMRRVGFTLGPEAGGRRIVVEFSAFVESKTVSGYTDGPAIEVNGEVMGLESAGRPRLLNRPMEWRFDKARNRTQTAGRKGVLDLGNCVGSARWTLPCTPSVEAFRASASYAPLNVKDVVTTVIEITDMVHADSFNFLNFKNEGSDAAIVCRELTVRYSPAAVEGEGSQEAKIRAAQRSLEEKYLDRPALVRESAQGREWVYDMDLIEWGHGGSDTLAELENIEDARRVVRQRKEDGYNAIIVSGLHFRYDYIPFWETRVLPHMRLLCQAAHEAGLKVIDHHDVPIFFSGGYPFLLEGDHLDWTQRDLRYGTPMRIFCLNNPEFRAHYFNWSQRVQRECGIDGYQIDEVYFPNHLCGCEACRRLFTEATGLELPREADSPVLFNSTSPLWQTFKLWQQVSMQNFKRDFLAAVRKENPAAFLSDYTSSYFQPNEGLWSSAFVSYATGTEAMSRVPFDTYLNGMADMRLRQGLADAFDHASWVLWYPLTGSTARFCWALSQATGQAQWHTAPMAGSVRDLVRWPEKMKKYDFTTFADVAMIFSEKSKNASAWTGYYHGMETFGWGAAMADANIQYHILEEIAVTPELLAQYKMVILPQMTLIDRPNLQAIEAFVKQGGKLVVIGETGMLDELGRPRPDFLLGEMMDLKFVDFVGAPFDVVEPDGKSFVFDKDRMLYHYGARFLAVEPRDPARSRTLVTFRKDGKDYPGIVEADCGKGKVYSVAGFLGISNFQGTLQEGQKQIFRFNPDAAAFMGRWLRGVLAGDETLVPRDLPPRVIMTSWIRKQGGNEIDVHFMNVQDNTRVVDVPIMRREIKFPRIEREMTLLLRRVPVEKALFYAPDLPEPAECSIEKGPEGTMIVIPAGKMTMYGLLKIQTAGGAQ